MNNLFKPNTFTLPSTLCLLSLGTASLYSDAHAADFNVSTYGAKGDGTTLNTAAIQSAVDAASKAGGGIVILPAGRYLSGAIYLKSRVELRLERNAVLLGSTSRADYGKDRWSALVEADGQEDVKITGQGIIDGQGLLLAKDVMRRAAQGEFGKQSPQLEQNRLKSLELPDAEFSQKTLGIRPNESDRPMLLNISRCRRVEVSGVMMKDSSSWVGHYERCDGLTIKDIRVDSTVYWNNDGIDVTDCRNVKISGCDINTADDGICLKSGASGALGQGDETSMNSPGCENVEITNCRVRSSASAFKMGTASFGGFRKIRVSGLTVYDTYRSAIALESVDGGTIDDVVVENVTAANTGNAIFMRLGQRNKKAPPGIFQNVTVRNVKAWIPAGKPDTEYGTLVPYALAPNVLPSAIAGIPGYPIRNVKLENIEIFHPGGGNAERGKTSTDNLGAIPENIGSYPEISMFGELPAWGFYVRHAEGVEFRNVTLVRKQPDYRPVVVIDNVHQFDLTGLTVYPEIKAPDLFFRNVKNAKLSGSERTPFTPETISVDADSSGIMSR